MSGNVYISFLDIDDSTIVAGSKVGKGGLACSVLQVM